MNDDAERYVRWYAHLEPDAPLDPHAARALLRRALADREALAGYLLNVECAPSLLGEFIHRHWDDAPESAAERLVSAVMQQLTRTAEGRSALETIQRGGLPSARRLRRICEGINDAR